MSYGTSYPERLRRSLAMSRAYEFGFIPRVWALALHEADPPGHEWGPLLPWLEEQFRSAYDRDDSPRGRLRIAGPEVIRRATAPPPASLAARPAKVKHEPRCLSGDGCDRPATCGRFGLKWCDYHGAELAMLDLGYGEGREKGRVAA